MKKLVLKYILPICFLLNLIFLNSSVNAQSKFKAGLGLNFVSTYKDIPDMSDYVSTSVNFSYTFCRLNKFSLAFESSTSFKNKQKRDTTKMGFITTLPLMAQYDFKKLLIYIGSGPAYLNIFRKDLHNKTSIEGLYYNFSAGAGFKLKPILLDVLYPELNVRLSYLKSPNNSNNDAGLLSIILFLRGK